MKRVPKWWIVEVVIFILLGVVFAFGQTPPQAPPPSKYEASEVQTLRLKVLLQKAILAGREAQDAQNRSQAVVSELRAEVDKVKKENGWPADVDLNFNNVGQNPFTVDSKTAIFNAPPPPPPPAQAPPKPAEPKKP